MADPKKQDTKDDRIAELELHVEHLTGKVKEAEETQRQLDALKGDLAARDTTIRELTASRDAERAKGQELQQQLNKGNAMSVAGLPDTAIQLARSVVISDDKGDRLDAVEGDVLLAGDAKQREALQHKLGTTARVFLVKKETVAELVGMNAVRGR